jgi:predicted peptidase
MRLAASAATVVGMLLCACGSPDGVERDGARSEPRPAPGRQVAQSSKGGTGPRFHYLLYLPERYGGHKERRWPLLLFLRGADTPGSTRRDLELLRPRGVPGILEQRDLPLIAVSPQTSSSWPLAPLAELLDEVEGRYAVDLRRVYATGFSIGGYAAFDLATAHPKRLAAIAPVAGGGGRWGADYHRETCRLRDVAVWAFHGGRDDVIPPSESRAMVDAVKSCGRKARLTVYPGAGHYTDKKAYAEPELYRWLLAQRR